MENNQISANVDAGHQIKWVEDQTPRFVGPDLDPYCLQRSSKNNTFSDIVRTYFHFVPEQITLITFSMSSRNVYIDDSFHL